MSLSDRPTARVEHDATNRLVSRQPPANKAADGLGAGAVEIGTRQRVGRRGLERLRTALSARDYAILDDVARCRLMQGRQLQQLYFPVGIHASLPSAARSSRRVLRRLVDRRLLITLERRVGGVRAGSEGLVYGIGPVGRRLLKTGRGGLQREPSLASVTHTLTVAECYVRLRLAERSGSAELLALQVEAEAWRYFTTFGGRGLLAPDLFVQLRVGHEELAWWIEVDRGTEHRQSLRRKAERFVAYYRSGEAGQFTLFPRVLWLVPHVARATGLSTSLRSSRAAAPGLFVVSTEDQALAVLLGHQEGRPL